MVKKFIISIITISLIMPIMLVVANNITLPTKVKLNVNIIDNANDFFYSNRYTNVDDLSLNLNNSVIRNAEDVTPEENNKENYDTLVVTKNNFTLYYNKYLSTFKVKNNKTGYIWSTGEHVYSKDNTSSTLARNISSIVTLGYYNYNQETQMYSKDILYVYTTRATEKDNDFIINPSSGVKITNSTIPNGIKMTFVYPNIGIKFNVYVTLNDKGNLDIEIPNSEIEEKLDGFNHLVATIRIAPGLGSAIDTTPGYLVIPDGSGGLIRYGEKTSATETYLRYYGVDYGAGGVAEKYDTQTLTMPMYGIVNGINQDAMLAVIEKGEYSAQLTIGINGSINSKRNYLIPTFIYREKYLLYGITETTESVRNIQDIKMHYEFINDENANYVGIANNYRNYLLTNDLLVKTTDGKYRLRLDILMSEAVKALIGTKIEVMTSLKDLNKIIDQLNENEINDLCLVLMGWNSTGLSGTTPHDIKYNSKVASKREFKKFIEEQANNKVYFYNDYVLGGEKGDYSNRIDVARTMSRLRYESKWDANVYDEYAYLYPKSTLKIAKENIKKYNKLDIDSLALNGIGTTLFSTYYKGVINHRGDNANYYLQTLDTLNTNNIKTALFTPFTYLWRYTDSYLDLPLYTNQYTCYTDTVPLVAYTLRGAVDYYASYTNFFANQEEQILRLLDYGALPSYIITNEESRKLKYTDSYQLYTSVYEDWKVSIIENYNITKQAYNTIKDSYVVKREVLGAGLVKNTYSNNSIITIDYRNLRYKIEGGMSEWIVLK